MAMLIGMSQEVKGTNLKITETAITIGRKSDNTVPVDNSTVSGHHCEVTLEDGYFVVRDLGSTNGTRVNTREIKEAKLRPKDILQVGSIEFMFDAAPGEIIKKEPEQAANVEVAPGPAAAPESFGNISPFGARRSDSRGLWFFIMVSLAVVALAVLVLLFIDMSR
jgi:pSer/pThr/pTyr-binding forkhead associated (FHA) protein